MNVTVRKIYINIFFEKERKEGYNLVVVPYNRYDNNINPSTGAVNIKHKENIISSAAPAIMRTVHYIILLYIPHRASGRQDEKSLRVFIIYTRTYYIMIIVITNVLYAAARGS